jgi:small conductance mechanosensitive channel
VRSSDYWTVYWDMTRQVKERFDAEGISIPFPQTDMHVYMPRDERVPFVTEEGGATAPASRQPAIGSRPPGATGGKAGEAAAYASGDEGHDEPGGHTDDERS